MSMIFAVLLLAVAADARPSADFTKDSLDVVYQNVAEKKAVLVDVRSVEEWNKGHIEGAIFLPIDSLRKYRLDPTRLQKALPKNKILYTYCLVGMRAKAAATILQKQGFTVRALKPGYEELVKYGFAKTPTEVPPKQ